MCNFNQKGLGLTCGDCKHYAPFIDAPGYGVCRIAPPDRMVTVPELRACLKVEQTEARAAEPKQLYLF